MNTDTYLAKTDVISCLFAH